MFMSHYATEVCKCPTKVGDIANDVAAHKVSLLIYNKDE